MLSGPELGTAIESARALKGVNRSEMARHFKVQPESTYDWTKHGRIAKERLPQLFAYFADVVGPEHWGLAAESILISSQPVQFDLDRLGLALTSIDKALSDKRIQGKLGTLAEAVQFAYLQALKVQDPNNRKQRKELDDLVASNLGGWDGREGIAAGGETENRTSSAKTPKGRRRSG